MKKVFNSLFVIIAAMVTFAGCAKQETDAPATSETKTVQFFANSIETKTVFGTPDGTTYPTLWTAGDKVKILVNLEAVKDTEKTAEVECSDDYKSASFTSDLAQPEAEAFTFYSVSPSTALLGKTAEKLYVNIPSTQTPLATSVDKTAQLLYAASETTTEMPSSVELAYHHLTAYGKFSLSNLDAESVSSIKLEADFDIAGKWDYFVEEGSFVVRSGNGSNKITLTTTSTTDIWFACAPVDVSNKTLTLTVTTNKGDFVKELDFPANRKFEAGKISKFTVDMKDITVEGTDEPGETTEAWTLVTDASTLSVGDEIVIVAPEADKAMGADKGNNRNVADVSKSGNTLEITDNVQIITLQDGNKSNTFAFYTGTGYLYAASSSSNYLKTKTTLDDNGSWSVSVASNGVATIKSNGNYTRNTMRYNPNNGSPIFSCYASTQTLGTLVSIYKRVSGSETPEPEQPKTLVSIAVAGQTTTYTVGDTFEFDGTVTATYDDESNATVTPTSVSEPDMNTVGTKEITVSYTEGEVTAETTYTITVNEAPAGPIVATIEEFLAAEDSETVWYQLTGTISSISNATFGNFDLTDETGTVYVYGLKKSKDAGNQTFSELGLKEGDTVTLIGNRDTYVNNDSEKAEVTNAYYVSHVAAPYLTVSSEAISVASTATSAEFTVDANVEWTVSCLTAIATKSGNNVTVSFAANETAEEVVYEVVVNSELGDETVTITQAAASQGGGEEIVIFKESFGNNPDKARVWNDSYKEQSGIDAVYSASTYTMTNLKQGKNTTGHENSGIMQSSSATPAYFEVKNLNVQGYSNFKVSYYWKAGSIKGTYYTKLYYSTDGGNTYVEVEKDSGIGATSFVEVKYTLPSNIITSSLSLKVEFSTSNTQANIDEFVLSATN